MGDEFTREFKYKVRVFEYPGRFLGEETCPTDDVVSEVSELPKTQAAVKKYVR